MSHVGWIAPLFLVFSVVGCSGLNTVRISTSPEGARVFVNDRFLGETPKSVPQHWNGFSGETLHVKLEKPGYKTFHRAIPHSELHARHMAGDYRSGSEFGLGITHDFSFVLEPEAAASSVVPPPVRHQVGCDLKIIQVSDASAPASATGQASSDRLGDLAKELAKKFKDDTLVKGQSIAVVSFRNRSGTSQGKIIADELADKVSGALIETRWFDVKDRIDLRAVLAEQDLDAAGIVKNEAVRKKLAGVRFIVIGGVTVTEPPR